MLKREHSNPVLGAAIKVVITVCATIALAATSFGQSYSSPGPMRGLYTWFTQNAAPQASTPYNSYCRFVWSDLETSPGVYNFSEIDQLVNQARAKHQKFGFRIMACWAQDNCVVPQYLVNEMPNGFWCNMWGGSGNNTYVPDWNSPAFITAATNLINALGARYNNDPAVGWVDIGLYGDWGEWHVDEFPYSQHPKAAPATQATEKAIINAHIAAFSNKRLIMLADDPYGLQYALSQSPAIGIRMDSLGDSWFTEGMSYLPCWYTMAWTRWKTAPFIAEFYDPNPSGMFPLALWQVQKYHVAMVGNGNVDLNWSQLSTSEQQAFENIGAAAGYNFQFTNASCQLLNPKQLSFSYSVQNAGIAPAYDPWNVTLNIVGPSGNIVVSKILSLNLETLMPTSTPHVMKPKTIGLPDNLPNGAYSVRLIISDPNNYMDPMPIVGSTANSDGSYTLASFQYVGTSSN